MNRLVIIGNGFDLAHGLKTKYSDFIDDFWKEIIRKYDMKDNKWDFENDYINIELNFHPVNFKIYNDRIKEAIQNVGCYCDIVNLDSDNLRSNIHENKIEIKFKNSFLEIINRKRAEKWVDIENEYYYQLKKIVREKHVETQNTIYGYSITSEEQFFEAKLKKIKTLNDEFEQIEQLFEKYLKEKVEPKIQTTNKEITRILSTGIKLTEEEIFEKIQEFPKEDRKELLQTNNWMLSKKNHEDLKFVLENNLEKNKHYFLNFNYTSLIDYYKEESVLLNYEQIQIHGKIEDETNKINFGFGDEMDDDYKIIENLNENEYLRNFKSFGYSQNSNYKDLLDFIETEKFQVYVMGHSCGISDRTMLNTIFEHNNCRSIKIFYHQWKDENEQVHDNYTELVQNISRHFNKKKLMREKVVNKSLCQPLPQIKNDLQL